MDNKTYTSPEQKAELINRLLANNISITDLQEFRQTANAADHSKHGTEGRIKNAILHTYGDHNPHPLKTESEKLMADLRLADQLYLKLTQHLKYHHFVKRK